MYLDAVYRIYVGRRCDMLCKIYDIRYYTILHYVLYYPIYLAYILYTVYYAILDILTDPYTISLLGRSHLGR